MPRPFWKLHFVTLIVVGITVTLIAYFHIEYANDIYIAKMQKRLPWLTILFLPIDIATTLGIAYLLETWIRRGERSPTISKRPPFQFHLVTLIAISIMAGLFIARSAEPSLRTHVVATQLEPGRWVKSEENYQDYGWPFWFYSLKVGEDWRAFQLFYCCLDVTVAIGNVAIVAFIFETAIRRREARKPE